MNKDNVKKYLNERYSSEIRIDGIKYITLSEIKIYASDIDPKRGNIIPHGWKEEIERNGSVILTLINPRWSGYRFKKSRLTWVKIENGGGKFSILGYNKWIENNREELIKFLLT